MGFLCQDPVFERRVSAEVTGCMLLPSLIAARSIVSSSFDHDRRSRTRMMSNPKFLKCGRKVLKSIQENKRHTARRFVKKIMSWTQRCRKIV